MELGKGTSSWRRRRHENELRRDDATVGRRRAREMGAGGEAGARPEAQRYDCEKSAEVDRRERGTMPAAAREIDERSSAPRCRECRGVVDFART